MSHFFLYLFFTTAAIATNADVSSNENMEIHGMDAGTDYKAFDGVRIDNIWSL